MKTDDFLAFSPNDLNDLGLGSTQLLNVVRVYNHKRHGIFILAGQTFEFRMRPYFPKQLSEEFLFVEFLNERPNLPEEVPLRPERLREQIQQLSKPRLERLVRQFGKHRTRKLYARLCSNHPLEPDSLC